MYKLHVQNQKCLQLTLSSGLTLAVNTDRKAPLSHKYKCIRVRGTQLKAKTTGVGMKKRNQPPRNYSKSIEKTIYNHEHPSQKIKLTNKPINTRMNNKVS